MADMPIGYSLFSDDYWAFRGSGVAGVGGATSFRITWDDVKLLAGGRGDELVVDGVTVAVQMNAGGAWRLQIVGKPAITHALGSGTAAAIIPDFRSFFPLNMPLESRIDDMITITAPFAQFDQAFLSAWGHYRPTPTTPQVIPVKVEELHIWPPKKKVGPV